MKNKSGPPSLLLTARDGFLEIDGVPLFPTAGIESELTRRLTACWNSCDGIDIEWLEDNSFRDGKYVMLDGKEFDKRESQLNRFENLLLDLLTPLNELCVDAGPTESAKAVLKVLTKFNAERRR